MDPSPIDESPVDASPIDARPWQRLDPRNLMLDPVKVVGQFAVPAVIAMIGLRQGGGGMPWWALPFVLLGAVAFGALPWLTTFYRATDTQLQVRSGWLNKKLKTAPLDRVRSVDLEASLLHRVLGLTKVQIGTGVDDDRIVLDSLSRDSAAALRAFLLARRTTAPANQPSDSSKPADSPVSAPPTKAPAAEVLATINWDWLRFAPFSLSRLVLLAGAIGLLAQFGDDLPITNTASSTWNWVQQFALWLVIGALVISCLIGWILVSVTGYVVQWWNMRLTRGSGSLHLTAGLFTTRSISVEEQRVRGVQLSEPLLLRAVRGAELHTLATGVGDGGVTQILPPCPRGVAQAVGEKILLRPGNLSVALTSHGRAAHRRSYIRWVRLALAFSALCVIPIVYFDLLPLWLTLVAGVGVVLAGCGVAESAYRHLGHARTTDHLVVGSGALSRVRTVLEVEGIIGWVLSQTWFQRRVGLAHLIATTAAGSERVVARDIPIDLAIELADAATPGVLTAFLA